jgi:hypothetical protein
MKKSLGLVLFGLGAVSMLPVVAYARHRRRKEELGGVMDPMTSIYTPEMGTVDDAELESPQQAETPTIRP